MSGLLAGVSIKRKDGATVDAKELQGKVVALYFSAHWCPPCRNFTPILRDFYDEVIEDGDFEIVFVSFDRSDADLQGYLKEAHGNWLYVPFGDEKIQELANKFGVSGIPALIVVKADGDVISQNGRADVQGKTPKKAYTDWKAQL